MAILVLGRLEPPAELRAELERIARDLPEGTVTFVQHATGAGLLDVRVELPGVGTGLGSSSFGDFQHALEYLRSLRDRIRKGPGDGR